MNVEELVKFSELYSIYGKLFSEKQQEILTLYFDDNLQLQEIADIKNTTRQAVYKTIISAKKKLEHYHTKLQNN